MALNRRGLGIAIALAAAFRAGVFVFAILQPIPNENGRLVSPVLVSAGIDFGFYSRTREAFFRGVWEYAKVPSAPVLPILLEAFSYPRSYSASGTVGPGNTLPLAVFFFVMGTGLSAFWIVWLGRRGVPTPWLVAFALLPNPLWLTLNISTDLPFAVLFGIFYWAYFGSGEAQKVWVALVFSVLAILTRPNGIVLMVFLFAAFWLTATNVPPITRRVVSVIAAITVPLVLWLYLPQLLAFSEESTKYFGFSQAEYLSGVFNTLPVWLDRGGSTLALLGAKLLYFTGLRPSYGDTAAWIVVARSAAGIILLPGILYMFVAGDRTHRLFIAIYMAPVLFGASQDRYNLAIQPLLFFFGYQAYAWVWRGPMGRILGRRGQSARVP
jgi:hypothetical protein